MKPKPFASLNHFTVPVAIFEPVDVENCIPERGTARSGRPRRQPFYHALSRPASQQVH
jgi:hypothetical protein